MNQTSTPFDEMFGGDDNRRGFPFPPVDLFNPHHIGNNGGGDPPVDGGDLPEVTVKASRTFSVTDKLGTFSSALSENRFADWKPIGTGAGLSVNPNFPQYSAFADDVSQITWDISYEFATAMTPAPKIGLGLKLLGGTTIAAGIIKLPKKWFGLPVGFGGSKKALASTLFAYKVGLKGSLGRKVPTFIGPRASSLETAIGRNAVPAGATMFGVGYLAERLNTSNNGK